MSSQQCSHLNDINPDVTPRTKLSTWHIIFSHTLLDELQLVLRIDRAVLKSLPRDARC